MTSIFCQYKYVPMKGRESDTDDDANVLQVKRQNESEIEFAERVQQMTAAALGITATQYSKKEALELRMSLLKDPQLRDTYNKKIKFIKKNT